MYDIAIIGAGISGLYCAMNLKDFNIILFESDRIGGRIWTHQNPQYEIGAGRFNRSHKILWSLIKKYNLEKDAIKIPSSKLYLETLENVEDDINKKMSILIDIDLNESLRKITFYQYSVNILGKKEAELLLNQYGYYSEFKVMNAYDAIRLFKTSNTFYVMKNGLQSITDRMYKDLKEKITIKYEKVTLVERIQDGFNVNKIQAKNVIFTIPTLLLTSFSILNPFQEYIKIPVVMPLLRIYADYGIDFGQKITTSSILKYIIPITKTLVMISYTDGKNVAPYLNGKKLKSESVIKKMIKEELSKFVDVSEPTYFKCHYWPIGTHTWPIGINSDEIANKIINPLPNIYICGDGFSHKQGWMEGALETAKEVVDKIKYMDKLK
jgi:hypothetical protein